MATAMGDRSVRFLLTLLLLSSLSLETVTGSHGWEEEVTTEEEGGKGLFILGKLKRVVKTDAGEVKVVSGYRWKGDPSPMHIGFISMEPNTLFIPQYIDANLILFVRSGEVKIGWIYKDKMVERKLKAGDIDVIPAGSAFYLMNKCKDEKLQIIASIDSSESLGYSSYQSFFIGGGTYPIPVLAGFDPATLTTAFNVSNEELGRLMRQTSGPIVHMNDESAEHTQREEVQKKEIDLEDESQERDAHVDDRAWTWRKLFDSILGKDDRRGGRRGVPVRSPHPYNLYDSKPNFRNNYGSSIAIDENDYAPLKHAGVSVYLVNLTGGSMLAPHVNPTATEYGIILGGLGTIQVVFPNGSTAMNAEVAEGDVFWIPRYFPFCQVASRGGPLEFFGFTTSSRKNQPQFLVGASSVLRSMRGPELAAAFGVSEKQLESLVMAQHEEIILPTTPERERVREKVDEGEEVLVMNRKMVA